MDKSDDLGRTAEVRIRNQKIVFELAKGVSANKIASQLGCTPTTVRRLFRRPKIKAAVFEMQAEMLDAACGQMSAIAGRAVETLAELLESKVEGIRLGSAQYILGHLGRMREQRDVAQRLQQLEAQASAMTTAREETWS